MSHNVLENILFASRSISSGWRGFTLELARLPNNESREGSLSRIMVSVEVLKVTLSVGLMPILFLILAGIVTVPLLVTVEINIILTFYDMYYLMSSVWIRHNVDRSDLKT